MLALALLWEGDGSILPTEGDAAGRALEPDAALAWDDHGDELEHEDGDENPADHERESCESGR